jgi:hypothetical protein
MMLEEWFGSAPQLEMQEDVIGLGSSGKTLTFFSLTSPSTMRMRGATRIRWGEFSLL